VTPSGSFDGIAVSTSNHDGTTNLTEVSVYNNARRLDSAASEPGASEPGALVE